MREKKYSLVFLLTLFLIGSGYSQEMTRLEFQGADSLSFTEKANLRIRENGRYIGSLYKEVRGYFSLSSSELLSSGGTEYTYAGTVYVLEDQKRNNRQAKWIDAVYDTALRATDRGEYTSDKAVPYPRTRGFPVLLTGALQPGHSWREYGEQVLVPREGARATKIEFYCEFTYQGLGAYLERKVHIINAQYATRYARGQDPDGDPQLSKASGKHLVTMYIDTTGSGWMFLRDQIDEQFDFADGSQRSIEGFYLTWFEGAVRGDREEEAIAIAEKLESEGVDDVEVEPGNEGITLSIKNIHFIPDQAVILPNERHRLDGLYEALSGLGDRTIKAVGHTADIGTKESQYTLSVERAKVVVDEMIKRGIPPERFMYEGRGGTEPVAPNDTEEGRAQNRRVELVIVED